ncbi:hypothetical protein PRIPAC_74410 [Pristionchus pacificus]|uniref:Uncharacterized protein n=1 Tax=Pristionchus pacificus TaxID=54126 RepID=A0A2A6C199_PRIPA|nr:hypothetical protein PRIPAC_74410 [Pristionchus pacificus]|eukprot:PDM71803.1 hypothetical protein PRIPAC_38210 [Pristionchus pacificus]
MRMTVMLLFDQLFYSDGELLSLADFSSDAAGTLLMDTVAFMFGCTLILWPPPAFTACGLILENLPRPRNRGGSLLRELEIKVLFNRLYLSLLPALFVLYELVLFGYLLTAATCFLLFIQLQSLNLFYRFYKFTRGETKVAREFSIEELAIIDKITSSPAFYTHPSYSIVILLNDRFFINERRFGYSIERMTDLKLSAIESNLCVVLKRGGNDFTMILVENTKTGGSFKIHSNDLSRVREFVNVEMKCKSIHERFLERFTSYIDVNPKFIMRDTASFDACFACYQKQPDVIIKKSCIGGSCTVCACRPTWCVSCLARIFAVAQPADKPSHWMDGTAACPTCRATFCPNDVLFIIDKADL